MHATRDLRYLKRSGLTRTARLHAYMSRELAPLASLGASRRSHSADPAVAFVVIELDNLWAGIARSLFLSAAFCARDGAGNRLQLSNVARAKSTNDALTHAIRRCKKSEYTGSNGPWTWSDEPRWWLPGTLLDSLDEIGASNHNQVSTALGASPGVFDHLHIFRNFYAHRDRGPRARLAQALRRLQFPTTYTATQALTSPAADPQGVRPQPMILDWLDDIRNTIALLV